MVDFGLNFGKFGLNFGKLYLLPCKKLLATHEDHVSVSCFIVYTDLTEEQKEIQNTARQFTRDVIIPAAPELDKTGEVYMFGKRIMLLQFIHTTVSKRYNRAGLETWPGEYLCSSRIW